MQSTTCSSTYQELTSPPDLAKDPDILARLVEAIEARGVVGEARLVKLLYLAIISRDEPRGMVSIITKAASSSGKSYVAENVFAFFALNTDYLRITSMSPKSLAYAKDIDLRHKTLFIGEASGLGGGDGPSMLRQLLSEGRIDHWTVIDGKHEKLHVPGPMNAIVTTTAFSLDAELETRTLTIPLDESADQTCEIMKARGRRAVGGAISTVASLKPWHALQRWLSLERPHGPANLVIVPYGEIIASLIPPVAVRLRRDFNTIINLISAHALLHRATREHTAAGIVATIADYAVIRDLVGDLISDGVEVTVKKSIREVVEAVDKKSGTRQVEIANRLKKDKSNISRTVEEAIGMGYLRREDDLICRGAPLPPEGGCVLPTVEAVEELYEL